MRIGEVTRYKNEHYVIIGYYDGLNSIQDKMEKVAKQSKNFVDFEKKLEPELLKVGIKLSDASDYMDAITNLNEKETLIAITSTDMSEAIYSAPESILTAYVIKCRMMGRKAFKGVLTTSEYHTALTTYFKGFAERLKNNFVRKRLESLIDGIYLYAGKEISLVIRKDNKYYKICGVNSYNDIDEKYSKILQCLLISLSPENTPQFAIQKKELQKLSKSSKLQEIKVDENHLYFFTEVRLIS